MHGNRVWYRVAGHHARYVSARLRPGHGRPRPCRGADRAPAAEPTTSPVRPRGRSLAPALQGYRCPWNGMLWTFWRDRVAQWRPLPESTRPETRLLIEELRHLKQTIGPEPGRAGPPHRVQQIGLAPLSQRGQLPAARRGRRLRRPRRRRAPRPAPRPLGPRGTAPGARGPTAPAALVGRSARAARTGPPAARTAERSPSPPRSPWWGAPPGPPSRTPHARDPRPPHRPPAGVRAARAPTPPSPPAAPTPAPRAR